MMLLLLLFTAFAVVISDTNQDSCLDPALCELPDLDGEPKRLNDTEALISNEEVERYFKQSANVAQERLASEQELGIIGGVVQPGSNVTDINIMRRRTTDPYVHMLESKQLIFEKVTDDIIKKYNLSEYDVYEKLPQQPLIGELSARAREECITSLATKECDQAILYRTADGSCNNLLNPDWGSAGICFRRLVPPSYVGASGFRQSKNGEPLPQPRILSLNIHYHVDRPTTYVNNIFAYFAQFLANDVSQTPMTTTAKGRDIDCCPTSRKSHPQCAPILIPEDDPFYSPFNVSCLNFVRSAICPTCSLGYRQQMNQVTAFIDGSVIYGNSENETRTLRTLDGTGRLRFERSEYGELLPFSPDPNDDFCSVPETNDTCFQAGDSRANQHLALTSLHTIFMREHNRLADGLRKKNPAWNDETVFQEARRIVGAELQVIVYTEYLPILLGRDRMSYFNLWSGRNTRYDVTKDPSLVNEFSAAAFRSGHSLINSIIASRPLNATNEPRLLRDSFFQPFDIRKGIIDPLMSGVVRTPAQWLDRHIVPDVSNYLYRIRGTQTGLDLTSINIQRGRDHGLQSYVEMVRFCSEGEIVVRSFSDLVSYRLMRYEQSDILRQNYRDVGDIDLWTGCVSEIPNDGAVVGPTAACIIGLQFNKLKFGDRFFFEHRNQVTSFTYQQLEELKRVTLSKIICLNTKVGTLPANALLFSSRNNPSIQCSRTRGVDLSYWKDKQLKEK